MAGWRGRRAYRLRSRKLIPLDSRDASPPAAAARRAAAWSPAAAACLRQPLPGQTQRKTEARGAGEGVREGARRRRRRSAARAGRAAKGARVPGPLRATRPPDRGRGCRGWASPAPTPPRRCERAPPLLQGKRSHRLRSAALIWVGATTRGRSGFGRRAGCLWQLGWGEAIRTGRLEILFSFFFLKRG